MTLCIGILKLILEHFVQAYEVTREITSLEYHELSILTSRTGGQPRSMNHEVMHLQAKQRCLIHVVQIIVMHAGITSPVALSMNDSVLGEPCDCGFMALVCRGSRFRKCASLWLQLLDSLV